MSHLKPDSCQIYVKHYYICIVSINSQKVIYSIHLSRTEVVLLIYYIQYNLAALLKWF